MELNSLSPQLYDRKPLSEATKGWIDSKRHPLFSTQSLVRIRAQMGIHDWLLVGGTLQALVLLVAPLPLLYALAPTLILAAYKIMKLVLVSYGLIENQRLRGVFKGRFSAVFPEPDGSTLRPSGKTVGGEGMCMILLTARCNHPLGIFHPMYKEMGKYARAMYIELKNNPEEYGFLGMSDYLSSTQETSPTVLTIIYFRSVEHLHKFAHGKVHMAGVNWWNKVDGEGKADMINIGHETYCVEAGKWETIYGNSAPYGFGATTHAIKDASGKRKWACPVVNAEGKDFKTSARRMGTVSV